MPRNTMSRNTRITVWGLVVVMGVFGTAGLYPYVSRKIALQREIAQRRADLDQASARAEQLHDLTRRNQLLLTEVRDYDRLVPSNKDLGTFLGQLSGELEGAGMQDTAVRALAPTTLGKVQQLPIEVRGRGSYAQFQDFLKRLEDLPRMSSVNRLNVQADQAMSGYVSVELTLSIYNTVPVK